MENYCVKQKLYTTELHYLKEGKTLEVLFSFSTPLSALPVRVKV
jgi:hypothetical protein